MLLIPKATASWMGDSRDITSVGFDCEDPSLGFDSNGTMYYSFTQHVWAASDHEICFGKNSNGLTTFEDYINLTDSASPTSSRNNGLSQIFIDKIIDNKNNITKDIVHIVWQGIPFGESDYEIYYTNNSGDIINNIRRVTSNGGADTEPSIVVVNGTKFIAYYDGSTVRMKTTLGGNSIGISGTAFDITESGDGRLPKLSLWSKDDYSNWRVDLAYIDTSDNDLTYENLTKGQNIGDFNNQYKKVVGTVSDLSIDSNKFMAAFCYLEANEIYAANSTDTANPKRITFDALDEGHPNVIINENNIISIFYVKNDTGGDSAIMGSDNYGSYFNNKDLLISKAQTKARENPFATVNTIAISSFDVKMCQGEGVIFLYDARITITPPRALNRRVLYLNGYANLYDNNTGGYNSYHWYEDLGGYVYNEGWLIEAIEICYNTSTGTDLPLLIRITDNITGISWENQTLLPGSGGNFKKLIFFQPNNYFIAMNPFKVELINLATQDNLLKLNIDPLEFSNGSVYSNSSYEGSITFPYTIQDENIGSGFEFSIFYFDKSQSMLDREATKLTSLSNGELNKNNQVDLYKFQMEKGEQYNMSITATGSGSGNCRISIFQSGQQITNISNALYTNTTSNINGTYFQLFSKDGGKYYVVIENLNFNSNYSYRFRYKVCPLTAQLISPSNNYYIQGGILKFEWDIDNNEFSGSNDLTIDHYELELYDNNYNLEFKNDTIPEDWKQQTVDLTAPTPKGLSLPDGVYYWQVLIVSSENQASAGVLRQLNIDTTPPEAPVMYNGEEDYYDIGQYKVKWSVPSDDKFTVHHYNLYRDVVSDFECNEDTKISVGDTLRTNSYSEIDMKTNIYYYKVIAVDNVGLESEPSNYGEYVVSISGLVDASDQEFKVKPGDYLEYKIIDVYEQGNKDPNKLYCEFKDRRFQIDTLLNFRITYVNPDNPIPVRGDWWMKWMNTTSEQLNEGYNKIGSGVDLSPLITSADTDYQKDVFELFMKREFENASEFTHEMKKDVYYDSFKAMNVIVHSFYTEINYDTESYSDIDFSYDSAIFIVDAKTGVLIELTVYHAKDEIGYSLKLINTNIGLSTFCWWCTPLLIIALLGIIAAIINQIIKKKERKV
ncbi:MAG: hypothetical protein ACTSQJ_03265 [Promethearchaeota archaeon]